MPKIIFGVFEPIKYSWKIAPIQILIQARTWGKATHVALFLNEDNVYTFINFLKENDYKTTTSNALKNFNEAGSIISATWPRVKRENIFKNYINDKIYLKELETNELAYNKIRNYYFKKENKEGYAIAGLGWFLIGPIVNVIKGDTKEPDPNKEFCSEAGTNSIYSAGIKIFSFISSQIEDLIMLARQYKYTEFLSKLSEEDINIIKNAGYKNTADFYKECNNGKYYFGYKISPRVFKINPLFNDIGILTVKKKEVYLKL